MKELSRYFINVKILSIRKKIRLFLEVIRLSGGVSGTIRKGIAIIGKEGVRGLYEHIRIIFFPVSASIKSQNEAVAHRGPLEKVSLPVTNRDSTPDYRHYEPQLDFRKNIVHRDIKILSYYLPQFHPIPENDLWHGTGFTEWTKVRATNPLFIGHYQQHIPHPDIGYYTLDGPETLRMQSLLMEKAGVFGQIFYHYWFCGKIILEKPAQVLLETKDINMPFCFCWANENWTRRWDGNEKEILLAQNYSPEDARAFIRYLIPFFKDDRYIRVDNRPVLYIYRPSSIPDPATYIRIWSEECSYQGVEPPFIVAVLTRGAVYPRDYGMDAGVERVLHDWTDGAVPDIKDTLSPYKSLQNCNILDYSSVAQYYQNQSDDKDFLYFRSLVPTWDNTPRYGDDAYLLHGSSPETFQNWLQRLIQYSNTCLPSGKRFIVINAWNEWAEGAHLEPDTRYGYGYLNSVGRALSDISYTTCATDDLSIPRDLVVHITFSNDCQAVLSKNRDTSHIFFHSLTQSSVFDKCIITTEYTFEDTLLPSISRGSLEDADIVIEFRDVVYFSPKVLEKMVQSALYFKGAVITPNTYSENIIFPLEGKCSITPLESYHSPLSVYTIQKPSGGFNYFRVRPDAHCFPLNPGQIQQRKTLPVVTTIIRFHKSGDFDLLRNTLSCLITMQNCIVLPVIASQDLSFEQLKSLEKLVDDFPWNPEYRPQINTYYSSDGKGDLRSKMLNESLLNVKTHYAAFLDYDDLLLPHAYEWMINRLQLTGKAIAFGRVYETLYNSKSGQFIERKKSFEYGYSYEEFFYHNHAPLHSFLMDLNKLDLSNIIYYEDQRYMEDYLLTLQLFSKDNSDWDGLAFNKYIGDYIHSVDRPHTLAFSTEEDRAAMLLDDEYMICERRISDIRNKIRKNR